MNKKLLLFCLTILSSVLLKAQVLQQELSTCGSGIPPVEWENWMSKKVEEYKQKMAGNKSQMVVNTIPVIIHVIYFGEPIGTFPNIDTNQIKSQIPILNNDFAGTGLNASNVPTAFAGLVANTGIKFCLANKDRQDQPLIPYGIERISAAANPNWINPNTPGLNLENHFKTVIMPATIWDPTKYLNIWISDKPPGYPKNGFATYPPATGLTGLFNGDIGTTSCDGIWIWTKAWGDVGTLTAPYNKGRTATHELGHWLGLRHIWGDGNCLSDYVGDTPTSKQAHYGCVTSTPPDQCGVGTSPNGEMPMNFMDRSDDACMYMFTKDQNIRMQTALSQSSLRYQLSTSNKCHPVSAPSVSAAAAFSTDPVQCLNRAFTPFNMSAGFPYPTYVWSSSPSANFYPSNSVPNPAITLSNPGTYTLTLVATNSLSSSTATFVVSAQNTCAPMPFCFDSIAMIKDIDTLTRYKAPTSSIAACGPGSATGYMTGTNCYKDKEIAQFFPPSSYSAIPNPQVNSVIVLFDSIGTNAVNPATQVLCKIYGGSVGYGPTSVQGLKSDSIGKIMLTRATPSVGYIGKPNFPTLVNHKFYPFRFDLGSPVVISSPNSGFYIGIQMPPNFQDSICVLSNTKFNSAIDSSAWYLTANLTWRTFKTGRGTKIQLAILPILTCGPVGIQEESFYQFSSNINIMPNPSSGLFNFLFTFKKEQSITMTVFNSLGQIVSSDEIVNVMNNMISVNLSDKPDGIYFAEITNGTQKVVKKLIVSH